MRQVYNFSPGPAMLPEEVLQQAQHELLSWQDTEISPMESPHRGAAFQAMASQSESLVRELLRVPDNFKVLFLAGGATAQFALIPLNCLAAEQQAAYLVSGLWSKKAYSEATRYGKAHAIQFSEGDEAIRLTTNYSLPDSPAYVYYCANETIDGIETHQAPESAGAPLVSDLTSNIFSQPIDFDRHGLVFASAQKNAGHAGVTLVIVRDDLIGNAHPFTPSVFNYAKQAEAGSCLNTPPTYAWYFMNLTLQWMKRQGGVSALAARQKGLTDRLYQLIDSQDFYHNRVHPSCRSRLNVPFTLANPELDALFLEQAAEAGLVNLAGHRAVGGMRASIYFGMPEQGVETLLQFMQEFMRTHG